MSDIQATYWLAREHASDRAAADASNLCAQIVHKKLAAAYRSRRLLGKRPPAVAA